MKLVNYQEDLVLHIAEIVLQDRPDVDFSQALLLDTAAYTLNRLPPRYIVSERGFTRLMADHLLDENESENLVDLVELLLLVNTAVDVVAGRRSPEKKASEEPADSDVDDHIEPHWHNIPYLIGRVIDSEDRKPIPGVKITLFVDGVLVDQAGSGWTNPHIISGATRGFYSFLPIAIHAEEKKKRFGLEVKFEIEGYKEQVLEHAVKTQGELSARLDFRNDGFINLGTTSLKKE